jgi:hypothetical protein
MGIMINGGTECLVTLMIWGALFYSHKKMRRLVHIKIKQFDYMLNWLLVSADTNTVTEKVCADHCPKTCPCITETCHDKKRAALVSDRKVHMTASRPVVGRSIQRTLNTVCYRELTFCCTCINSTSVFCHSPPARIPLGSPLSKTTIMIQCGSCSSSLARLIDFFSASYECSSNAFYIALHFLGIFPPESG